MLLEDEPLLDDIFDVRNGILVDPTVHAMLDRGLVGILVVRSDLSHSEDFCLFPVYSDAKPGSIVIRCS